ncbi:MAG: CoA transferase [Pseudomonadota bacterium]|nr:CoA transferase [Pseudomonadota bacterium]
MRKPLAAFTVLDLTNVLAGPFCGHQLAHMGARVIKIETPDGGDLARELGADPALNACGMGVSFLAQNAGKESITLDLKDAGAKAAFLKLVAQADVVLENFRPGVMGRLGLDYAHLQSVNPDLIYCAISGFGQDGPLAHAPAYDQIVQGMSGLMSITGTEHTGPLRAGYPVADTVGGLTGAFAVAAALAAPAGTRGVFIDVSMLESTLATMGWAVSNWLVADVQAQRIGNENMTAAPSGTFRTADGLLNIAANKQAQFAALVEAIGCVDLLTDPRFAHREARLKNRYALKAIIEEQLVREPSAHWVQTLVHRGIPVGEVLNVSQALAMPQVRDRGFIESFSNVPGVGREVRVASTGYKLDGQAPRVDRPPPRLGEHTAQILAEFGIVLGTSEGR